MCLTLGLVLTLMAPARASEPLKLSLNGAEVSSSPGPYVTSDNVAMLPVRAVAEAIGYTVEYDGSTKTVTMKRGPVTIQVRLNSDYMSINGREAQLTVPVAVVEDRAFMSLDHMYILGLNGTFFDGQVSLHSTAPYPDGEAAGNAFLRMCGLGVLKRCWW